MMAAVRGSNSSDCENDNKGGENNNNTLSPPESDLKKECDMNELANGSGICVTRDGKSVILCQECGYVSDKKTNFRRHFETMHSVLHRPRSCCSLTFSTKAAHRQHVRAVHADGHQCSMCHKVFSRKALLERHMSIHTGFKQYACTFCTYASGNKSNVLRHMVVHQPTYKGSTQPQAQVTPDSTTSPGAFVVVNSGNCSSGIMPVEAYHNYQSCQPLGNVNPYSVPSTPILRCMLGSSNTAFGCQPSNPTCPTQDQSTNSKRSISHSIESILSGTTSHEGNDKAAVIVSSEFPYPEVNPMSTEGEHAGTGLINEDKLMDTYSCNWSQMSAPCWNPVDYVGFYSHYPMTWNMNPMYDCSPYNYTHYTNSSCSPCTLQCGFGQDSPLHYPGNQSNPVTNGRMMPQEFPSLFLPTKQGTTLSEGTDKKTSGNMTDLGPNQKDPRCLPGPKLETLDICRLSQKRSTSGSARGEPRTITCKSETAQERRADASVGTQRDKGKINGKSVDIKHESQNVDTSSGSHESDDGDSEQEINYVPKKFRLSKKFGPN